ncbi:MAG: hypothetical protein AB8B81_12605 [Halioglobus sp.]
MKPFLVFFSALVLAGCESSVTCIDTGDAMSVTYDDVNGVHREIVVVGSDYGFVAENKGVYSCMGQCGGGCTPDGPWLESCLSHDICSFRNKSSGFLFDESCGDEAATATLSVIAHKIQGCHAE